MFKQSVFLLIVIQWLLVVPVKGQQVDFEPDAYAQLALDCVHQEYPNKIAHVLNSDADVKRPRDLYPAFYGCYDWHSAVHGHWQLARYARRYPESPLAEQALAKLRQSITPVAITQEVAYLETEGRKSFERPYGLAWLMQLHTELVEMQSPLADTLKPLVLMSRELLAEWLPKLLYPIRIGEHAQTAFAFGLMLDWANTVGDREFAALITGRSRVLYQRDINCPLSYEPSGQDFLSPCIAEADLMRRVLSADAYAKWLSGFLPSIGENNWLPVARVSDREDGKLAHLDGLNISRAWMLQGMAAALPAKDRRKMALQLAAKVHRRAGLEGISSGYYAGQHWLGSFAMYLDSQRGTR